MAIVSKISAKEREVSGGIAARVSKSGRIVLRAASMLISSEVHARTVASMDCITSKDAVMSSRLSFSLGWAKRRLGVVLFQISRTKKSFMQLDVAFVASSGGLP